MSGKVFLIGAGPGDPDLLTVKAARILRSAEAVLYDALVSAQVLQLVSPFAQLHNVGKLCGKKKITQAEINFLMAGLASSGLNVVRLKSGDPLVFGRLGEEIEALRAAKIDYEVIPGVTAGFGAAAAARFPLTHRNSSPAVILLTGHRAENQPEPDWHSFVASGATLVIYMPGHEYGGIAVRLKAAGTKDNTPCAIVSRATRTDQQLFVTTIGELTRAPRLAGPTVLVVGEVVKLAHSEQGYSKLHEFYRATQLDKMVYRREETENEEPVA